MEYALHQCGCGRQLPDSGRGKSFCRDCAPSLWSEVLSDGSIFYVQQHQNMAICETLGDRNKRGRATSRITPELLALIGEPVGLA